MRTNTKSCALPGQMTLEEISVPALTMRRRRGRPREESLANKSRLTVNEKNCRRVLAEKFKTRLACVAIVEWCMDDDVLCIRAYIQCVDHLVLYKGGFSDTSPKAFKVLD